MSIEVEKKVSEIEKYLRSLSPKSHPMQEHPIINMDEFFADTYIDMLCLIAQYKCDDVSNQIDFIERIMAAFDDSITFEEHSLRALSFKEKDISEFIVSCKERNLLHIFFVESIILTCLNGKPCEEKSKFLAMLANVFEFDNEKLEVLLKLSVSIIEQNKEKYNSIMSDLDIKYTHIIEELLVYIKTFIEGVILCNQDLLYVYYKECNEQSALYNGELDDCLYDTRKSYDYGFMRAYNSSSERRYSSSTYYMTIGTKDSHKKIVFENVYLNANINFGNSENISLIGCRVSGQIYSIAENCLEISNSLFVNGPERIHKKISSLIVFYGKELQIKNCEFYNCHSRVSDGSSVMFYHGNKYAEKVVSILIENSIFKKCTSNQTGDDVNWYTSRTLIAEEADMTVRNCKFIDCGSEYHKDQKLFFGGKYVGENNIIEGPCEEYSEGRSLWFR